MERFQGEALEFRLLAQGDHLWGYEEKSLGNGHKKISSRSFYERELI